MPLLVMSNSTQSPDPIQVDPALLEKLICQGPTTASTRDIPVYKDQKTAAEDDKTQSAPPSTQPQDEDELSSLSSASTHTKLAFRPQRRYYLEGRIVHKRKLSRKLFFLDVSLVRPKKMPMIVDNKATEVTIKESGPSISEAGMGAVATGVPGADGFKLSEWEYIELDYQGSTSSSSSTVDQQSQLPSQPQHAHNNHHTHQRMEVIARFPVHSLKGLDDLWRRVQLGSIVKVFGDIELSERYPGVASEGASVAANGAGQDINRRAEDIAKKPKWSALLHCLDFEILELWQGKETFEPNPGTSDITGGATGGPKRHSKKRKSGEMDVIDGSTTAAATTTTTTTGAQERGDASQPHCKFWLNSGKCNKDKCVFWHETDPAKLKVERRRWVEERIQAKRQISHHASDPHQKTTKNQHRERALYFAHWLIKTFTRDFLNSGSGVLDIAGGRGDLSWELQTRQGIQSTVVEPRPGKGMRKWQRKWLLKFKAENKDQAAQAVIAESEAVGVAAGSERDSSSITSSGISRENAETAEDPEEQEPDEGTVLAGLGDFIPTTLTYPLQTSEPARIQAMLDDQFLKTRQDLVRSASIMIGLHPDQATEPIVRAAIKTGKPFAIIPCCVFGRDNLHRRLPRLPVDTEPKDVLEEKRGGLEAPPGVEADDEDPSTRPVTSYDDFVTWLSTLHPEIETTWLNFEGMNRVLFWRGPLSSSSSETLS